MLVIDDEPEIRHVVRSALRSTVARVLDAADGRSALATVRAQTPDLIVLDLGLPVLSGLEVYLRLKQMGKLVPTIVVTGKTQDGDTDMAVLRTMAEGFLVKPFDPRHLLRAIAASTP